jgi:hypothetical protein
MSDVGADSEKEREDVRLVGNGVSRDGRPGFRRS